MHEIDNCTCCRLAKSRASNLSSSIESVNSSTSRNSDSKINVKKMKQAQKPKVENPPKRLKDNNDEVVCTPDLQSMLEPDCQLTTGAAPVPQTTPPPLVLRNSTVQIRTVSSSPVYHVVNGYRIDLNSAAQKGIYTLPNGKMIQVKRTGVPVNNTTTTTKTNDLLWSRPCDMRPVLALQQQNSPQQYNSSTYLPNTNSSITSLNTNEKLPNLLKRHAFPKTPLGMARSGLQDKIISAQIIYQHFNNKLVTFCNSNAYTQARNYNDVKDLYVTLSCMCSYTMARMQGLQNEILEDMRQLGFGTAAANLKNGQFAAGDCDKFENIERDDIEVMKAKKRKIIDLNDFDESEPSIKMRKYCFADEMDNEDTKENNAPSTQNMDSANDFDADFDDDLDNDDDLDEAETENSFTRYDSPMQTFADSRVRGHGTEASMRREEQSHAYDRKLTRLIEQYPSIWCTLHADYGNFEVTRKQWRTIAVHFKRSENIKLRWKNIRKRYVRIERRIEDGKRFTGYFDKATNFLSNRNLPMDQWKPVDCGEDDGDTYARENLDALEESISSQTNEKTTDSINKQSSHKPRTSEEHNTGRPIEVLPIDTKIINFVKRNPILWRRVSNGDIHNQYTVRNMWQQLWRSMSGISFDDMVYRWHYLYEMYKAFRLKKIKNSEILTNLELKYSKYLAKLYFLYKIDEQVMRRECTMLNDDLYELDVISEHLEFDTEEYNKERLQDAEDDKEFVLQLVRTIKLYPALWTMQTLDYNDASLRSHLWHKVLHKLTNFKSFQNDKQEENKDEVEIIETPPDTITIDSDDDNTITPTPVKQKKIEIASTAFPVKLKSLWNGAVDIKKVPSLSKFNIANMRPTDSVKVVKINNSSSVSAQNAFRTTAMPPPALPPTTMLSSALPPRPQLPTALPSQSLLTPALPSQALHPPANIQTPPLAPIPFERLQNPHSVGLPQYNENNLSEDDLMYASQSFLASMLEVEIEEPDNASQVVVKPPQQPKKQPRKKTTNKINPVKTSIIARERLEALKKNDRKLALKCYVRLQRVEEVAEYAKYFPNHMQKNIEDEQKLDENEIVIINEPIPISECLYQKTLPVNFDFENIMPASIISVPSDDMKENTTNTANEAKKESQTRLSSLEKAEQNKGVKISLKEVSEQEKEVYTESSGNDKPLNRECPSTEKVFSNLIENNSESSVKTAVHASTIKDVLSKLDSLLNMPSNITENENALKLHGSKSLTSIVNS